ncbi:uncharacterized protein [Rutidosis leptorrhynchoides]|uniref:uncharacterized protein n=1 Tax=Rutidosis leptorrhynchoides TaxID=125765 RepID=UPI003A995DA7
MAARDEDKTALHTTDGIFCYVKMSFELKNAGATYQCVIDMAFKKQIGMNVEAYVYDIVIKSNTEERMIRDILETFESLRTINMKLNPKKRTFGFEEDQQIKKILKHPESSWRLVKWAVELGEYEINISPWHEVKGQILADFLLKTTEKVDNSHDSKSNNQIWELHTDGVLSEEGIGAGLVLTNLEGEEHTYALKFCFYASNNEAEYEALLSGLRIATEMGIKYLRAYVDSQIVAQQVNGAFEAKDMSMKQYLQLVEKISKNFESLEVLQISRNKNKKADVLSKLETLAFDHLHKKVLVEVLKDKSIDKKLVVATIEDRGQCWMTLYIKYLQDGTLQEDITEARRIKEVVQWSNFRCLAPQQAIDVVKEMHEGLFAQHYGYRTIAAWIMRQGYYWQTIYRDTAETIKTCDACQRHGTVQCIPKCGLPNEIVHGLVEVTSKEIMTGIKARFFLSQTKWVDEAPYFLWAHRTTPKRSTGETPFSLLYDTEAVIPVEIRVPTHKVLAFDVNSNSSVLCENLNLLEERRIMAAIRQADAKQRMAKYYNKRMKHVQFKE